MRAQLASLIAITCITLLSGVAPVRHAHAAPGLTTPHCADGLLICTEVQDPEVFGEGVYVGHDEPSLLFYSNTPGSGNSNIYQLTLPTDPPTPPQQDGSGGTYNFQLHTAFWFGMAMCDTESAPEYTRSCTPNSDANIFDGSDPAAPDYVGHHPGTAFMELQFYPPGWVNRLVAGTSCDAVKWCAALTIDSLSVDPNNAVFNNKACLELVGVEPVNFAFVTRTGVVQAPANPIDATIATLNPSPDVDLFMSPGDRLVIDMHDTTDGFTAVIDDRTSGQTGSMTASVANGFGQVIFEPDRQTCRSRPYAFHPMYATSSEHTRVPWAAHSFNVTFTDEIGHFEYCDIIGADVHEVRSGGATATFRGCALGPSDPPEDPRAVPFGDDFACFPQSVSMAIHISGCTGTDDDFDGVSYRRQTWPGSLKDPQQDATVHASPIRFSSPLFNGSRNYDRVAFETDLPSIERATNPCETLASRRVPRRLPGQGCVIPPAGADFYPIFSTGADGSGCTWQFGGPYLPGTTNTFGGNATSQYGALAELTYPSTNGPSFLLSTFRRALPENPCPSGP